MANGTIDAVDFIALHKPTIALIADIQVRLEIAERIELSIETALGYLSHILWNTRLLRKDANLQGKKAILSRIFPNGLSMSEKGFGTPLTHSLYTLLSENSVNETELVAPPGNHSP